MRSETFNANGITATVRSRNRRTAITEAVYGKAIRDAHPEIDQYVQATASIMRPGLPIDDQGNVKADLTPDEHAAMDNFMRRSVFVEMQHGIGKAYSEAMGSVVPLLARIMTIGGAPFYVESDGHFSDADVVKALEDWLNDEGEETGFWAMLTATVNRLDAPLTPVQVRPPETLTPEEQADPLSAALEPVTSSG